ncbi:hypothetical protein G6F68_017281 [Rhizopus microsporus]|nr:hypothetical protein G6F68_017281 [Rhizopus microsporus]
MERVVVRLAVMTGGRSIRREDLLRHAPGLMLGEAAVDAERPLPEGETLQAVGAAAQAAASTAPAPSHDGLHDGLKRALAYLKDHAAEPVTLGDLARQAHVSQSHLGFLFRSELGTTFKLLLQQQRIEHAKQLLRGGQRLRITDVALQVGFGDLSHFEKSFRRLVGVSPRSYRRIPEQ